MTADLVLTDTGHILAATDVPAWLKHPANYGRVCRVQPLHPHGDDGATTDRYPGQVLTGWPTHGHPAMKRTPRDRRAVHDGAL